MTTWKDHKRELMKDREFKSAYDKLAPEYELASALIEARLKKKLTQEELAKKAGVSRVVIARLEGGNGNPTMATVNRIASALGKKVRLVGTR